MEHRWVRVLGFFELIGGVLALLGSMFTKGPTPGSVRISFELLPIAVCLASATAGILLLKHRRAGVPVSLAIQIAQVLSFNAGWRYVFLVGPKLTWVIAAVGTRLDIGGGGLFVLSNAPPDGTLGAIGLAVDANIGIMPKPLSTSAWAIGINLAALYFARRLWHLRRELRPTLESATPAVDAGAA